jgi:hypothetical protein
MGFDRRIGILILQIIKQDRIPGLSRSAILSLPQGTICSSKELLVPGLYLVDGHRVCLELFCERPQKPPWPLFEHLEVYS